MGKKTCIVRGLRTESKEQTRQRSIFIGLGMLEGAKGAISYVERRIVSVFPDLDTRDFRYHLLAAANYLGLALNGLRQLNNQRKTK